MAVQKGQFRIPSATGGFNYGGTRVLAGGENFELTWNGPQVLGMMLQVAHDVMDTLANSGLDYMRSIVPVRTGYLQSTCYATMEEEGNRIIVKVGAEADYAVYVELGTSRMEAQPYIRPTADWMASELNGMLQEAAKSEGF